MPSLGGQLRLRTKRPKAAENKGTFETHVREMNNDDTVQTAVMEIKSIAAFFLLFLPGSCGYVIYMWTGDILQETFDSSKCYGTKCRNRSSFVFEWIMLSQINV